MTRLMQMMGGLALVVALAAPAAGQGALAPIGVQLHDNNGDPCNLCVLYSFAAGTTTPLATYADAGLSTSNGTSVTLDASGRANIFLSSALSYKLTLRTAAGVDIWTRDGIVGPLSGVISVTAANTRGIQVSRTSADAGISVASSGGSGRTWGLVSGTDGGFSVRDDGDGTPTTKWLGDNITSTLVGTFTVSGGLLSVTGYGDHVFSASGNGPNRLGIRNTSSGTAAVSSFMLGNDAAVNAGALFALSSGFSTSGSYVADGVSVEATRAGGLSLNASHASGDVRVYAGGNTTPRLTVSDTGAVTLGLSGGFLAYNSLADSVSSGGNVDFDTEVYDTNNAFSADVFTAPVTGVYLLCAGVGSAAQPVGTSPGPLNVLIVTSNRSYKLNHPDVGISTNIFSSGCVIADMDAGDTASVQMSWSLDSSGAVAVEGGASPYETYFSGRYLP